MVNAIDSSVFIEKFKEEAADHIKLLNDGLLKYEKGKADAETISEIFRAAHTLKGSARMVGLDNVGTIAHKMEDLLGAVKDERIRFTQDVGDLLFVALDTIQLLLESPEQESDLVDIAAVVAQLEKAAATNVEAVTHEKKQAAKKSQIPTVNQAEKVMQQQDHAPASAIEAKVGRRSEDHEETIRVSTIKLDKLINIVGELAVNQIRATDINKDMNTLVNLLKGLSKQWNNLKEVLETNDDKADPSETAKLIEYVNLTIQDIQAFMTMQYRNRGENVSRLDHITSQLEKEVFEVRMLPVSTIFDNIPRAVRDLAKSLNKEVEVEIYGEETELDKKMLEELSDPIVHLIRNSVDHGIEPPEVREKLGKDRCGKIQLRAKQEGEHVEVSISDDGKGLDAKDVKRKASELELATESDLEKMSDEALFSFLFHPGFSTKKEISEVSGRGVGLDVVKANIEKLEGTVRMQSIAKQGMSITMKVPLTMAITRCLLVKISEEVFGIPTTAVEETTRIDPTSLQTIEGRSVIKWRGQVMPIVFLADILGLQRGQIDEEKYPVVIISGTTGRIGFVVEEHRGEQEMVIKGLDNILIGTPNIAGAAILGSGDVVMILHIADIMNAPTGIKAATIEGDAGGNERSAARPDKAARILVVDDAMATRELERNILKSNGYSVDVAIDGIDALERLNQQSFDLVVTDVQMPRLDGFALSEKIKHTETWQDIPVVIITSLSSDEDKKRGLGSGADAYISKSSFDADSFLETVRMVLGSRGK